MEGSNNSRAAFGLFNQTTEASYCIGVPLHQLPRHCFAALVAKNRPFDQKQHTWHDILCPLRTFSAKTETTGSPLTLLDTSE
jgi:hypothetical protein